MVQPAIIPITEGTNNNKNQQGNSLSKLYALSTVEILSLCNVEDENALALFRERQYKVDVRKFIGNPNVNALAGLRKKSPIELDLSVYFLLFDVCLAFAVPNKPTQQQVSSICEAIKQEYYFLTLEELIYVFGKAKNGYFGKHSWNGIDQPQIMEWLKAYTDGERANIATSRQGNLLVETDYLSDSLKNKRVPQDENEVFANIQARKNMRYLKEDLYWRGEKGEFNDLQLKEFYSLVPFDVVKGRYPKATTEWYLQASNNDLQEHFLAEVLENKAKACRVTFDEYKTAYPNKTEREYLQEPNGKPIDTGDTIIVETLAQRIGKEQRKEKAKVVRYVSSLGLCANEEDLQRVSNELYFLQKTDYEEYKKRVAGLEVEAELKRKAQRRAQRQRQYETKYKKRKTRSNVRKC